MKFRKKPVVIEARQTGLDYDDDLSILAWCGGHVPHPDALDGTDYLFSIFTLEGELWVSSGDWIICGVKGEFYHCNTDIFDATYEACAPDEVNESIRQVPCPSCGQPMWNVQPQCNRAACAPGDVNEEKT